MTTHHHHHKDDYPATLALAAGIAGHRPDAEDLGYQPTDLGAFIDWDTMATSPMLSTTERAVARIGQGLAIIEVRGGLPPDLAPLVRATLAEVIGA